MKVFLLLPLGALLALAACTTSNTYPDAEREIDRQAEVPPGGDATNRANGPVGNGSL